MQRTPLVSIIIPTHNRPELLQEAINSVTAQSMSDWQAIIIDDGSTPAVNERQIQAGFGTKWQVIRHSVPQGGAAAKNAGVNAAKGRYLAFLDDDDLFAPTYLANAMDVLKSNPQITTLFMGVACFGTEAESSQDYVNTALDAMLADAHGTQKTEHLLQFDQHLFTALLKSVPIAFQRPVTTRTHFYEVGLFPQGSVLDFSDWACRAALNNVCGLLNVGLYLFRVSGQSYVSKPNRRLDQCLAGLAFKKRLLADPRASAYKQSLTEAVKQAARAVAWENMAQGKGLKAVTTLLGNSRYGVDLLRPKFMLHALYSCVSTKVSDK